MPDEGDSVLIEKSARNVLEEACAKAGVNASGSELVRLGSNAVFRVPGNVIVRIGRDVDVSDAAGLQVAVARWLAGERYPANRALDIAQPVSAAGHVVTFWESAADDERYAPIRDVARLLRDLHALDVPASLNLPQKRPFAELAERTAALDRVDPDIGCFLRERAAELEWDYRSLDFVLPRGLIHGDANVGNVILDRGDRPVLIDLDSVGVGQREWDLVHTALFCDRFCWHIAEEYRAFADVYGFDILQWPGYPVLADYRELSMTAWLCGKAAGDPAAAAEARKRIAALENGGSRRDWMPY
ncbi:aminoglycoside phosphotransferase family protein [Amycolatopsis sp. NPDC004079]|uniref:aminoglycoside phosphotransferase family protein n=1 Tax=Amycolatopsis sp. NPDC004079 TaxID=3154549 RepID=UPI0033BA0AF7